MALVFQYGSNTSSTRLNSPERLAGGAIDLGLVCTREPWELYFDVRSTSNDCAAANIRQGAGRSIWGVLYEIPDDLISGGVLGRRTLDQIEGGRYSRRSIELLRADGSVVDAITYTVRDPQEGLKTSLQYASHILAGLREHGASAEYLDYVVERVIVNNPELRLPVTLAVYCADVGSVATGNFGWSMTHYKSDSLGGSSMNDLTESVADHLRRNVPVALGFECPLFVPLNERPETLTAARIGEGSRPWSAGGGCGALATGLVQVAWILRDIRRKLPAPTASVFLEWPAFSRNGGGLFLWEAFVSGGAKRNGHMADAAAAVECFADAVAKGEPVSAVRCPEETYSLIGAALLRTGWDTDPALLTRACCVFRAIAIDRGVTQ